MAGIRRRGEGEERHCIEEGGGRIEGADTERRERWQETKRQQQRQTDESRREDGADRQRR